MSRLLEAHELILKFALRARLRCRRRRRTGGDEGTNDLLISDVVRTNELQVWFIAEHLVDVPAVKAD